MDKIEVVSPPHVFKSGLNMGSQSLDERTPGVSDIPVAAVDKTNVQGRCRIPQGHDLISVL